MSSQALQSPVPPPSDLPEDMRALDAAASYLGAEDRSQLHKAWRIGAAAHAGQTRKSGEPYITHPVAVARVLAELGLDAETLIAAILHDTIEDTPLTRDDLAAQFGETVAELVEGVTKLDKLKFRDRQEAAAESFRKMMLAMSRDLRVILIKLADRLHNMRTLGSQSPEARRRIARETLEVYAPIAQRLGMNLVKAELQDLSFKALHPWRYAALEKRIRQQPAVRREAVAQVEAQLAQRLTKEGLKHRLVSRVKSPWSIYTKMRVERKSLEQVMDVFGFRVIVDTVPDCYHALGIAHATFKPLDGRFRDFIAIPKANGYQSLHTVLFGPYGAPIEVQIRTQDMDLVAERGIAAHWTYKQGGDSTSALNRANAWIAGVVESQKGTGNSLEFLENVKVELYPDEVYVFTPKGRILSLPRSATALDFAYAVHTDVGNNAVTARLDGRLVPLRTRLTSGQTVEIVTAKSAAPQPQWLDYVTTGKARAAIRQKLKQVGHEDAVQLGHRMLEAALENFDSSIERLPEAQLKRYLSDNRYPRLESLLEDIALGNRIPSLVAQQLATTPERGAQGELGMRSRDRILISGTEGGVISFAQCCMPIPYDSIMGYHTTGKGIAVHRSDCRNVIEYRRSPERCVEMGWDPNVTGDFLVGIRVEADNRQGVLAQMASAIAEAESNIDRVDYLDRDNSIATVRFYIEVHTMDHLEEVRRRLRRVPAVHNVERI